MEIGKERFEKGKRFLLQYKASLLLFVLFGTIIYFQQLGLSHSIVSLISSFTLFFFILLFAKIKFKWLGYILAILFTIVIITDAFCAIIYNSRVTETVLGSILESNKYEAIEMLGTASSFWPLISIIIITFSLIIMSVKEFRNVRISFLKVLGYYIVAMFALGICCTLMFVYTPKTSETATRHFDFTALSVDIKRSPTYIITSVFAPRISIFYSDVCGVLSLFSEKRAQQYYLTTERSMIEGMTFVKEQQSLKRIYLIVGESASSKHMSLYGYNTPTTPFLDKLKGDTTNSTCVHYYSAITSQLLTRDAVTYMLSAENVLTGNDFFYKYKNLIELANNAQYETHWISNQSMFGFFEGRIPLIASYALYKKYNITTLLKEELQKDDLELLPMLDKYYDNDKKQLFIIHLQGSHRDFEHRYDDIDKQAIIGDGLTVAYDRTIHHTDRFLQKLSQSMINNSVILYASDHGESPAAPSERLDRSRGNYAYQIPFVLLKKNASMDADKIVESYKAEDIEQINNTNTYYIIAEFMGYKVSEGLRQQLKDESKFIEITRENKIAHINDPFVPLN